MCSLRAQIPFAGSSAATTEARDTELNDQQQESVQPREHMVTGEPVFPSRSDSIVDSESSSSDDEAPVLEALSRLDGSASPRVVATGPPAAPSASNASPPVGVHWHDPRSLWRDHFRGLGTATSTLSFPPDEVRRRTSRGLDQLGGDDDDDGHPHTMRASPPPMGHYESGMELQQRPQTARSHGRHGQSVAVRIGSPQEPEPEPEAERVDRCGRRRQQLGATAGLDEGGTDASRELKRMSDDTLEKLQRELSRKLDDVSDEINRRRQAAIEHQVRTHMQYCAFKN